MIYLIDDRKERQQEKYDINEFDKYKDVLSIINNLEDGNISFLSEAACILFHNSFPVQSLRNIIRKRFKKVPKVYFSNKFRIIKFPDDNFIEEIRADILYQNLRYFLDDYEKTKEPNLKILAFGENYKQVEASKLKDVIYYALFDYDYETTFQSDWLNGEAVEAIKDLYILAFSDDRFESYYKSLMDGNCSVGQFLSKIDALTQKIK